MFWVQYKVNRIAFYIDRVFASKCILDICAFTAIASIIVPTYALFWQIWPCRDNAKTIKSWKVFYSSWSCKIVDCWSYKRNFDNKLEKYLFHITGN